MTFDAGQLRTPERQRSGAHRPRRSGLVDLIPALLVILAVLGVGAGVWQLNRASMGTSASSRGPIDPGVAGGGPSPSTSATPTVTASRSGSPGASATASAPSASGTVDHATPLVVLNATTRSGLAARAARALRGAGWTVTSTGNYRSQSPPTTVYYAAPSQQASAAAVAADLGGNPPVTQSSQFSSTAITVVLGQDYAG